MKGGNSLCSDKHRAVGYPVLKAQEMSFTGVTVSLILTLCGSSFSYLVGAFGWWEDQQVAVPACAVLVFPLVFPGGLFS
jgi:hypothetical protein